MFLESEALLSVYLCIRAYMFVYTMLKKERRNYRKE